MPDKTSKERRSELTEKLRKFAEAFSNYDQGELYREKGDYVKALECYMKAAEMNHPIALNNIGVIYMNGLIGERNYPLAIEYFKKAVKEQNAEALINLGKCYLYGTEEYEEACKVFIAATEIESVAAEAHNRIGVMYFWGNNYKDALECYKKAYELGYEDTYDLGLMYLYNYDNLTNNVEEGIRLLDENAMKRDDRDSSIELAYYLTKEKDNRATKYIEKCKSLGILDIEDRIQRKLKREDINIYQ